jgi:hypothetical protein
MLLISTVKEAFVRPVRESLGLLARFAAPGEGRVSVREKV